MKKMTIWGVGPKIMIPSYSILLVLSLIPIKIRIDKIISVPRLYIIVVSLILISIGVTFLGISHSQIKEALKTNGLITRGIYVYVRNPMYMAHLIFLIPGICLLTNNAITLLSILCAVVIFYIFISREENDLEEYFGAEYIQYKKSIGRLLPKMTSSKWH